MTGPGFPVFWSGQGINPASNASLLLPFLLSIFIPFLLSFPGTQTEAQEGLPVATLSHLAAKSPVDMVLSAGEHCSDSLIIVRAAENRVWLKDSTHQGLGAEQRH